MLRRFDAAWNAQDEEGVVALFADDAVVEVSVPPPSPMRERSAGRDEVRGFVRSFLPGFTVTSCGHEVSGDRVTWRYTCAADGFRRIGADVVNGVAEATIEGGRIRWFSLRYDVWEALREREAQYRAIFEATTDGLVIGDLDGVGIVEVNPAMCRMHGYTREEMLGIRPTQFIHPDYHGIFREYVQAIREGGTYQTRAVDVRKDGTPFHVEVHGTQFLYRGRPHVLGVVRDVTERVEAYRLLERGVEERTRELRTLLDVSHDVASTLEMEPLLGVVLDRLRSVVDYSAASVRLLDGDDLILLAYRGPNPDAWRRARVPAAEMRFAREVIRRGETLFVPDVETDDRPEAREYRAWLGERLPAALSYLRSYMGVPLTARGRLIGLIILNHATPHAYTSRHAELALAFANQAAAAIENAQLFAAARDRAALEERQRLARDLHDSVSQTLFSSSLIAEVLPLMWERDPDEGRRRLEELRQLTRGALAEMRLLLLELRPAALADVSLGDLLRQLSEATTGRGRLPVSLSVERDGACALDTDVKLALYRIAQEALHNAAKHASATRAEVALSCTSDGVALRVRDDGRGFETGAARPEQLGLQIMRERARAAGASLRITSRPGHGTTVHVRWTGMTGRTEPMVDTRGKTARRARRAGKEQRVAV